MTKEEADDSTVFYVVAIFFWIVVASITAADKNASIGTKIIVGLLPFAVLLVNIIKWHFRKAQRKLRKRQKSRSSMGEVNSWK